MKRRIALQAFFTFDVRPPDGSRFGVVVEVDDEREADCDTEGFGFARPLHAVGYIASTSQDEAATRAVLMGLGLSSAYGPASTMARELAPGYVAPTYAKRIRKEPPPLPARGPDGRWLSGGAAIS